MLQGLPLAEFRNLRSLRAKFANPASFVHIAGLLIESDAYSVLLCLGQGALRLRHRAAVGSSRSKPNKADERDKNCLLARLRFCSCMQRKFIAIRMRLHVHTSLPVGCLWAPCGDTLAPPSLSLSHTVSRTGLTNANMPTSGVLRLTFPGLARPPTKPNWYTYTHSNEQLLQM